MREWVGIKATRVLWPSYVVFVLIYMSTAFWPVSSSLRLTIIGIAYMIPPGAAVIGAANVALVRQDKERIYWFFVFAAMLAIFVGESYWAYMQITQSASEVAVESLATFGFMTGYAFLFLSVLVLCFIQRGRYNVIINLLITVSVMAAAFLASWFLQLRSIYLAYGALDQIGGAINVLYPMLDIALIGGIISIAVLTRAFRWPTWMVSVLIGLTIYAFGDIAFSYYALADAYQAGTFAANLVDVFWMTCYIFVLNGALLRLKWPVSDSEDADTA